MLEMREFFLGEARKLQTHLELLARNLGHDGEQGASVERRFREVLGRYLPGRYTVGSGIVAAHDGQHSAQQDVLIYDRQFCSPIYSEEDRMVLAVESVYGTVEVKSSLDKEKLVDANSKAASILDLRLLEPAKGLPGLRVGVSLIETPPVCAAFGFSCRTSLNSLEENFRELDAESSLRLCAVGVLDEGVVYRLGEAIWKVDNPEEALLLFLMVLVEFMNEIPDRYFRLVHYRDGDT